MNCFTMNIVENIMKYQDLILFRIDKIRNALSYKYSTNKNVKIRVNIRIKTDFLINNNI